MTVRILGVNVQTPALLMGHPRDCGAGRSVCVGHGVPAASGSWGRSAPVPQLAWPPAATVTGGTLRGREVQGLHSARSRVLPRLDLLFSGEGFPF